MTYIIEYAWIYLNVPRVLNIPKFPIWEGFQYASVTQRSKYARICLDRLNIFWVLNIPELQRWQVSEYTSLTEVFKYATMSGIFKNRMWKCLNMSEFTITNRVLNMYYTIHT